MKKILIVSLALMLSGCNTPQVLTSTRYQVVVPDNSMYKCPVLDTYPDPSKLTDVQVARTLVELYKNNQICKNSIDAIKKFLEQSKASIER
jgi:uncharacterized protein YcfL